jgi:hypothetical protein
MDLSHSIPSSNDFWEVESNGTFDILTHHFCPSLVSSKNDFLSTLGFKVSDALTYGPRFCEIYTQFNRSLLVPIDPSRHLFSLCFEYLVPFAKWARASDERSQWIKETLLENDYLRVEVRNGLVVVLIYVFAAIKSTLSMDLDMFRSLQDIDTGTDLCNIFYYIL